ncbi:MAG: hypothetical protein H6817_10155 [Phycisphaerales bacterium]|nr:hypothetical protein [Phycisphaerales bacterium]
MAEFVSESIAPAGGTFDMAAMSQGEPGLPASFIWREETFRVEHLTEKWKASSPGDSKTGRNVYLRRHYYKLRMHDGSLWTVYFIRQTPKSGTPKARWFLYQLEDVSAD